MSDDLRRLSNALERAGEDLATARVVVDTALRQLQDQIEEFLTKASELEPISPG
jgi:hypothetical protein